MPVGGQNIGHEVDDLPETKETRAFAELAEGSEAPVEVEQPSETEEPPEEATPKVRFVTVKEEDAIVLVASTTSA